MLMTTLNVIFENENTDNTTNSCTILKPCGINEGFCHYHGQSLGSLRRGQNKCSQDSDHGTKCCYNYCDQFLDIENKILDFYFPYPNY